MSLTLIQLPRGDRLARIHRRRGADPKEGLAKYGKATFADPVNNKFPIDILGRIKAAWAYIHRPSNAEQYSNGELRTIKVRIRRAAQARQVALPDRMSLWS